ncbi:hypothetical protein FSST1_011343 [Fusarium sambucinum]
MFCLRQSPSRSTHRTSSPDTVRSRRSHTKSRHGCLGCKQRRKKCDEQRPQCSRCLDKDIPCEYPRSSKSRNLRSPVSDKDNAWDQSQRLAVPSPGPHRSTGSSLGSTSSISSPFLAPTPTYEFNAGIFTHQSIAPSVDLGATELELFSYYLSHAARSMAYDDEDLYALQVGFPNLAFRSKPLMSSILALAAVRKCHDILSQPSTQPADKGQVRTLLALADEHHRDSLRQTRADIPNANHYDHVVANAPLMVLYATANHAVRIKLSDTQDDQDANINLAPAQLHWMTLIRAAHLAYTGLLHSTKDFSMLDDFTASPPAITLNHPISGLVPMAENEFLSIIQSTLDNIPDTVPDEGIQCDSDDSSETSRLAMDIFAHWLVLVMLLDGVWWIGGIGVCELGRITKYMGRQQEGLVGSKGSWWPRSMLNIALEIGKQD